jgi:hypothetical protein
MRLPDRRGVIRLVLVAVAAAVTGLLLAGVIGPSAHPIGGAAQLAEAVAEPTATPIPTPMPTPTEPNAPEPAPSIDEWRVILEALDESRSAALAAGDLAALKAVYVVGSPAYEADRRLAERVIRDGLHPIGLHFTVESVIALDLSDSQVRLRVVDRLDPYQLVGADGADGADVEASGRGRTTWDIALTRVGAAWRIFDVWRADDQLASAQRSTDSTVG